MAVSDSIALAALRFLKEHAIAVPQRISLVGFDNSLEAMSAGLTSFDFNVPSMAMRMLNYLLVPPTRGRGRDVSIEEVEGVVIPRHTVARVVSTDSG